MIYGESAGAGSVSCHLVMQGSFGLYQRALMESGPVARWSSKNMTYAQTQFDLLTNLTNCDLSKDLLSCLRDLPTAELVNLNLTIPESVMKGVWAPVVDGKQLTADPQILAAQQKFAPGIQVTLGTNLNEGSIFIYGVYGFSVTNTQYAQQLQFDFGPVLAPEILAQYPVKNYPDAFHALSDVFTDFAFACPARRTARWLTNASIPTYLYQFTHELDEINIIDPSFFGVFHASELFFFRLMFLTVFITIEFLLFSVLMNATLLLILLIFGHNLQEMVILELQVESDGHFTLLKVTKTSDLI